MAVVWQRHPRYSLFIFAVLACTFYLLGPYRGRVPPMSSGRAMAAYDLPSRLARSEKIYNKLLVDRQGLIKKFGPTPKEIDLFPPNVNPWPAYTVWDFFPAAYNCPHEIARLGALGDGGKWVCGLSRVEHKPDCIVYSVGINYESSFEAEILSNTQGCQIWGYDFTVNSFGPQISPAQSSRTHFNAYGLAGTDHTSDDGHKMYTLETLMKMNGHTHIDILKIDIERWEFETLTALIKPYLASGKPLPFGQLQLEVHIWNMSFEEYLTWWEMLEAAGLRPFWTEPNLVYQNYNRGGSTDLAEYSFLNIKGANVFIKDPADHSNHRDD
ncbi:methyltransferase domain-containing protein [Mycena maculata]|uniref:Methyltransferase domain-containing protein n=1 Tax=Mycena maculata TaxID=230809 RepID=A0AAD7K3Z1_9AGAR|nr:methyltransferase domain-containing protein [Mycena maculata]